MKPETDISEENLLNSITLLTSILSDEMTLYLSMRKFHWNASADNFLEFYKLFQRHYTTLKSCIDLMAERINKLGSGAIGATENFTDCTRSREADGQYNVEKGMLRELLINHEAIIKKLRQSIEVCSEKSNGEVTTNFLNGATEPHENSSWVLRRFLH